jgi:hypothetical protein
MAQAETPQYLDPYEEHRRQLYARQQQLVNAPQQPMFSPEEAQARMAEIKKMQMLGHLGIVSGDKTLTAVGTPLLEQALKAQQKKQTEHGEYDPLTGEFRYFPQYRKAREEEQLQKDIERVEQRSAEGRRQWQADRQRADEQRALRQTIAAMRQPPDPGSLTYAGTHPESGEPILLHSKQGVLYRGQPYAGAIADKPQGPTSTERKDIAELTSNIQGLDKGVTDLAEVKKKGGGTFSGVLPGYFADLHPVGQALVTKLKSDEEKNVASLILYISDGIRQGRFGMTLTPQEKASAVNYNPSLFDSLDEMQRKSVQLKGLLSRDLANRTASMTRPGLPTPGGNLGGPTAGGLPGGTGPLVNQPPQAPAAPGAPAPGQLPPGWSITPETR